jgi:hypothetical protein
MLVDRVCVYDDYHQFALTNDPQLWWLEMTKKQPPRLMPRTRRWYEQHSSTAITHDAWDLDDATPGMHQAVAVAAAARELDEVGYLS